MFTPETVISFYAVLCVIATLCIAREEYHYYHPAPLLLVEFRRFRDPATLFHIYSNPRSLTVRVTRYGVRIGRPAPPAPAWVKTPSPWKPILSL
jgi:hypothetical protein